MTNKIFILFFSVISVGFSQQKISKYFFLESDEIEINTLGLDTVTLINSDNNWIEVNLFNENPNSENLVINQKNKILRIDFKTPFIVNKDDVFRKFITERLNRSYAIVKIPKNKSITLYGRNINIISKSYQGNITVFIDKGIVKLNTVKGNVKGNLYQGTIYATISKTSINIKTNKGTIIVGGQKELSPFVKNTNKTTFFFKINAISANVILTEF